MHNNLKYTFVFLVIATIFAISPAYSQQKSTPKVFITGEHEKAYSVMLKQYSTMLLTVCDNDIDKSYDAWTDLLINLEEFANESGYDMKGAKLWVNVFWAADGHIDHFVFYPKPNARNLNYEALKSIIERFLAQYQTPLKSAKKFSHYGSANFPVISKSIMTSPK